MMTHLERLQRDLAILEAQPDGKDSKFAQGLKGQIAAAKFQLEQMPGNVDSVARAQSSPSNPLEQAYPRSSLPRTPPRRPPG